MILQALKEYYDRKPNLPRYGFDEIKIAYIITLDRAGMPINIESTYEGTGKERRAKMFLVSSAVKRTVGIEANLLWDNLEYSLGVVSQGKKRSGKKTESDINDRVNRQHAAFKEKINDLNVIADEGLDAVRVFLNKTDKEALLENFGDVWQQLLSDGGNISFKLAGDNSLVIARQNVRSAIQNSQFNPEGVGSICLITGDITSAAELHSAIKGVWGAQTSGANIVSFNLDAFTSFGKKQGHNAPVSRLAAFAYTTALNHLLQRDSKQKMQVGDATTVFWSAKETEFETQIVDFFGEPPKDDPDRNARAIKTLFTAIQTGTPPGIENQTKFYVLGLAPNASRIAVRFWVVGTIRQMAERICRHFADTQLIHGPKDKDFLSLWKLLVSTAARGKSENIPPNLAGETMRAILEGLPYPQTLLQAVVRRIRAEQDVTYPRAALIKACLNRSTRKNNPQQKEEIKVSLDENNNNVGYRLGRLFATLEKIQQEANPGINATIRDKFYGAASSTPVTVFGNLMRLKNHHLAKLENTGRKVNLERLIGEIMSNINDFPTHLNLEDQGRFAIGYYHQMQAFYTKKDKQVQPNT